MVVATRKKINSEKAISACELLLTSGTFLLSEAIIYVYLKAAQISVTNAVTTATAKATYVTRMLVSVITVSQCAK